MCWLVMQAVDGNKRSGVVCSVEGKTGLCLFPSADHSGSMAACVVTSEEDVIHPEEGRMMFGGHCLWQTEFSDKVT